MMLTSKQRAALRSLAQNAEALFQIGKNGVTPEVAVAVSEALEKRELVKLTVLNSCAEPAVAVADALSGRTRSEIVQVIGRKVVLYRKSKNGKLKTKES